MGIAKLTVLAVVIMLISQIPVGSKRICDHVQDITRSKLIQGPVLWISDRFDFSDGKGRAVRVASKADRGGEAKRSTRASATSSDDKEVLSGLLKTR